MLLIPPGNHSEQYCCFHCQGQVFISEAQAQQSLTFQHFHSNSQRLVGLLLVDADGLGHHHLPEAALAQRFTQSQPETKKNQFLLLSLQFWMRLICLPSTISVEEGVVMYWRLIFSQHTEVQGQQYSVCQFWNMLLGSMKEKPQPCRFSFWHLTVSDKWLFFPPFLPCSRKLPFRVWWQFKLRDVGQHRSITGWQAGDPDQRCVGVHGGVWIQGHLLGYKAKQTVIVSERWKVTCEWTEIQRKERKHTGPNCDLWPNRQDMT